MYYVIKGFNSVKSVNQYCDTAYNKSEKNYLIKQYKEYLKNKELDMIKVATYLNDGELKEVITYK